MAFRAWESMACSEQCLRWTSGSPGTRPNTSTGACEPHAGAGWCPFYPVSATSPARPISPQSCESASSSWPRAGALARLLLPGTDSAGVEKGDPLQVPVRVTPLGEHMLGNGRAQRAGQLRSHTFCMSHFCLGNSPPPNPGEQV